MSKLKTVLRYFLALVEIFFALKLGIFVWVATAVTQEFVLMETPLLWLMIGLVLLMVGSIYYLVRNKHLKVAFILAVISFPASWWVLGQLTNPIIDYVGVM